KSRRPPAYTVAALPAPVRDGPGAGRPSWERGRPDDPRRAPDVLPASSIPPCGSFPCDSFLPGFRPHPLIPWLSGALAVEIDQIRGAGFGAQLAQQHCDLAAVVGAVVHQVLQALPERIRDGRTLCGPVLLHAGQIFSASRSDELQELRLDFRPARAHPVQIWKLFAG